jgi:predicted metalloprotease with PDZ domain
VAVARARAWTGLAFGPGEAATIQNVQPGSPAFEAGLSYGHEVVAVEGWRTLTGTEAQRRLADVGVGGTARVLVADRGRVREVAVDVVEHPGRTVRIVPNPRATEEQKRAFTAWTGQALPSGPPAGTRVVGAK